ncbi:MAG: M20/M25/M40 family metallo-hydrolase [Pseudomonadota bacterium]
MRCLALLAACFVATPLFAADVILPENIAAHIKLLASDDFEGRAPGTRGEALTIAYLEQQLKTFGLEPGNPDGTYLQKVPLVGYRTVPRIEIEAAGHKLALNFPDDFVHDFPALRATASIRNAAVVFAGYGIAVPAWGWDDYKDVDVRNKLVIVLSGEPPGPVFKGDMRSWYSTREFKFDLAASKGAAGILIVTDPEKAKAFSLFQTFAKMEGAALEPAHSRTATLISGLITIGAARRLMSFAGQDFDRLQAAASLPGAHAVVTNARAKISVKSQLRKIFSHNVVARIEGSDPILKSEHVLFSAHWDHLGMDPTLAGDQIYNGAIDDAAGTAQMLEIARAFATLAHKPKRSILFVATTAEEKGYLGSRFYAQHPLYPISKTVANINLDGGNVFGRTTDLVTTGYGLSTLDEVLAEAAQQQGRTLLKEAIDDGGLYFASDQIEFAKVGIPAAFPFSGFDYIGKPKDFGEQKWDAFSKNDYHQVSDEVRPDWDYSGAAEDATWLMIAGQLVADAENRPEWKAGSEFKR